MERNTSDAVRLVTAAQMKEFARTGYTACVVLLSMANVMLFVWMMLMFGLWGRSSIYPLFHLFMWAWMFSYYCAAPIAVFGFICALGCSMAKQTDRAALLSALSGGALFCAILVWSVIHLA